ncbi:hypothetical protein [Hymenobacter sp. APR13]|uniref:hypothetical protein n=1 Tax=Hymenobacter sp. APR13 TaxID=1356852 RepID=UPI0004E045FD|nr:hypothetical protein [Hymenobacter sp. APR13]AII52269.1 hypothetical protein N008_09795 [Hymenobacter sp. APR13]
MLLLLAAPGALAAPAAWLPADDPAAALLKEQLQVIQKEFPGFVPGQLFRDQGVSYLFLDSKLEPIATTTLPSCNAANSSYKVVVVDRPASDTTKYSVSLESAIIPPPDLAINQGIFAIDGGASPPTTVLAQQQVGPLTGQLEITVTLNKETATKTLELVTRKVLKFPDCDANYQVGIFVGTNASFLSRPENIERYEPVAGGPATLVADNPTTHLAVSLMAVFYPSPRRFGYQYRDLDFWQRWNMSFGTRIGPNLLDDFLLGLNYEVSKGLNLGAGVHYGQHRVVAGQPDFDFGRDVYEKATFSTAADTRMRWDPAFYIGASLDLRVLGILRGRNTEQNALLPSRPNPSPPATPAPAAPATGAGGSNTGSNGGTLPLAPAAKAAPAPAAQFSKRK